MGSEGKARSREGEAIAVLRRLMVRRIGLILPIATSWKAKPQRRTLMEVSKMMAFSW